MRELRDHGGVGNDTAVIGDVIAHERHAVFAREQQRALVLLEEAMKGVVLHERGQPRVAEHRARGLGTRREKAADRDRERRLVAEYPSICGAVGAAESCSGRFIPARSAIRSRHASLKTSPASTNLMAYWCHGTPSLRPASTTSLTNGG